MCEILLKLGTSSGKNDEGNGRRKNQKSGKSFKGKVSLKTTVAKKRLEDVCE